MLLLRQLTLIAMPALDAIFDTSHNEAFRFLGALEPGQQWSAFDVPREDARKGKASIFVTTIWNFHSTLDEKGHRIPTERAIAQDIRDGTYWYRITKPPVGATRKTWVAHWNGLGLALEHGIPIVGVLKDVQTSRCSIRNVFDCASPRSQADGSAIWIELRPRAEVGCEVRRIDIRQIAMPALAATTLSQAAAQFDEAVQEALQRTSQPNGGLASRWHRIYRSASRSRRLSSSAMLMSSPKCCCVRKGNASPAPTRRRSCADLTARHISKSIIGHGWPMAVRTRSKTLSRFARTVIVARTMVSFLATLGLDIGRIGRSPPTFTPSSSIRPNPQTTRNEKSAACQG